MAKIENYGPKSWTGIDDIVIVGGGLAGLFCALKLAPRPVTVLASRPVGAGSSSAWAQGGIAAAVSKGDTIEAHQADTVRAGAGLVNENVARLMIEQAGDRIADLLGYGVPFDRTAQGALLLSREAAHSRRRVVRVKGDQAGAAIMAALSNQVQATPSIQVIENIVAERLITEGRFVTGIIARQHEGRAFNTVHFPARAIVLASGGIGGLYKVTTNPEEAHGSGVGMAARAGAILSDCEFVQFHPTALDVGVDPAPLATEALRGEGARLVTRSGAPIMNGVHPDGDLAPRDVVARGVFHSISEGEGAFIDCRGTLGSTMETDFPSVFEACRENGLNPETDLIPVSPAAHYHMGGVLTDANGRTSVDGLWACGEVAATGAHGANRLASNSLLEAVVFAARIADDIQGILPHPRVAKPYEAAAQGEFYAHSGNDPAYGRLREAMQAYASVVRDARGLNTLLNILDELFEGNKNPTFQNKVLAAKAIATAALEREESRGAHYRQDFPDVRDDQAFRRFMTLGDLEQRMERVAEHVG